MSSAPLIVAVYDEKAPPKLKATEKLLILHEPDERALKKAKNVFLLCSARRLPDIAQIASVVNRLHRLRILFVRQDVDLSFLTAMFKHANLRMARNVLVHSEPDLPSRILKAWEAGAADVLIATAEYLRGDDKLLILDCSLRRFEVPFQAVRALKNMPPEDRSGFEVAEDGSYLYWPKADVHLDLDAIRYATDPKWRKRADRERLLHNRRFGAALAAVRKDRGLKQSDIEGLSEREVRRIEKGETIPRSETLEVLAKAHGMTVDKYLTRVADRVARA